jgi:hypothetical protein
VNGPADLNSRGNSNPGVPPTSKNNGGGRKEKLKAYHRRRRNRSALSAVDWTYEMHFLLEALDDFIKLWAYGRPRTLATLQEATRRGKVYLEEKADELLVLDDRFPHFVSKACLSIPLLILESTERESETMKIFLTQTAGGRRDHQKVLKRELTYSWLYIIWWWILYALSALGRTTSSCQELWVMVVHGTPATTEIKLSEDVSLPDPNFVAK